MSRIEVLIGGTGISFGSGLSAMPDPVVCPPTAHASTPTASITIPSRMILIDISPQIFCRSANQFIAPGNRSI
jgi:hypothetical protein